MTEIISKPQLASYLRVEPSLDMDLLVELANGIVSEVFTVARPIPDPRPTRILAITLEVAARAYRNPNGYSSEAIDDYKYSRDKDTRQAGVYLTPDERAELLGIRDSGRRGSFYTVSLASPLDIA